MARATLAADPLEVAPFLLGKLLVHGRREARIVEVEAYRGESDPASHAYRGRTARNATMFGRAGLLYVYFTYGMHWCANVVCGEQGAAGAVLLRALEPVAGLEEMTAARAARRRPGSALRERDLCRGPGNLTVALGITKQHDGVDLCDPASPVRLLDDGAPVVEAGRVASGPRVGIKRAIDVEWRFWVAGSRYVS
ncbi:MAG: DNA-3-methyladenine glycosylase [Actinomycetota bacterium]|nr:DNA-3-methyladenine glycosylase [Actinomycetota bacterium]